MDSTDRDGDMPGWNLALRAVLEIGALIGWGWAGWHLTDGMAAVLLAIVLPVTVAIVWGVFAVPDDPSRGGTAPVPVPGWLRFSIELLVFSGAVIGLWVFGAPQLSVIFIAALAVHLAFSTGRVRWLLAQR